MKKGFKDKAKAGKSGTQVNEFLLNFYTHPGSFSKIFIAVLLSCTLLHNRKGLYE